MDLKRGLKEQIADDLKEKMVILAGPRQAGKTTLAKSIRRGDHMYLNYDVTQDRRKILNEEFTESTLWVFDEIHKFRKWKNFLKGIYDSQKGQHEILVTGSARLDLARKAGDSLQGRYHLLRMHPLTFKELGILRQSTLNELFQLGGFPEPFFSSSRKKANRWSNEYQSRVIEEEISKQERINDLSAFELLSMRLPECVGSPLSINALSEDLQYNFATVRRWLLLLEKFYSLFFVAPFGSSNVKAVKKERKHYHFDWNCLESPGARFECMIAVHLLKYVQFYEDTEGRKLQLRFFRDIEGREVDFVVTERDRAIMAIECKYSDDEISKPLKFFKGKFPTVACWQLSLDGKKNYVSKDGIRVAPAIELLKDLA